MQNIFSDSNLCDLDIKFEIFRFYIRISFRSGTS